ncbi:MAG: membrane protein insertase YidC [bacterium]
MEFDKKTILAFLLIGLILIVLNTDFYQKNFLPKPPQKSTESSEHPKELQKESVVPQTKKAEATPSPAIQELEPAESSKLFTEFTGEGDEIIVETNRYRAKFSTKGATLISWEFKKYKLVQGPNVQIIGNDGQGNLALLLPIENDTLDTSHLLFNVNKREVLLSEKHPSANLEFILDLKNNQKIKKTFTFYQDRYDVTMKIELLNMGNLVDGFSYFLSWKSGLQSTEPDFKLDMSSAKAYAYQGDAEVFNVDDDFDASEWDNPTDWVAIRTKYFMVAAIPKDVKAQGVKFTGTKVEIGKKEPWKKYGFYLQLPFEGQKKKVDTFTVYTGPIDYDILKSYNVNLEKMMDLGWVIFRPFAKFILWSFVALHKIIPNYGVVIIIFSILIKVLLYPLTKKSYQSMKEMQSLQPLMTEINEKYKNDPQKKQQEIMKLYKEHGVNPLGGCIPMVLQMPLLIALFNVFRSTIELRQAEFIWWITDLSRPDTIATLPKAIPLYGDTVNILPIFMGVTMFIQQKLTMKDPKQKAMIYFMPIFFTLLFNSFPSGLNLYYALFNLFSIFQEKLIPHKPKPQAEVKKPQSRKRRIKHDYKRRYYN